MDPNRRSSRRSILLWCATLAAPFAFFAACEGAARLIPPPDDGFVALRGDPVFFETFERDGVEHVRIAHDELYGSGSVEFPRAKAPGTLRIFTLGGSASAGWPLPSDQSYSSMLRSALQRALPDRSVEVFDASAHAWAAYRVRLVLQQAVALDPDLVVVYSGNNEFLEPRRYLPAATAALERLASVRWLRRLLRPAAALPAERREGASFEVWSKLREQALSLRADPQQLARVHEHYRHSIEGMAGDAAAAGIPLVLVTVPVNLRDWEPNVSAAAPAGEAGEVWRGATVQGHRALRERRGADAVRALGEAAALAPDHAETHFRLARALEAAGRPGASLPVYRRAADLDHNPFRALGSFNEILRDVAARADHVVLADAEASFLAASAPRAPGFDLFLDYVHPTPAGNRLVAGSVYTAVRRSGVLGPRPAWPGFEPAPSHGYDANQDPRVQRALYTLFAMMHQREALVARARRHADRPGPEWAFARAWLPVFEPLALIERRRAVGEPVPPEQVAEADERLELFYTRLFPRALEHDPPDGRLLR